MDCAQIFYFLRIYCEMGLLLLLGTLSFSTIVWILSQLQIKPNYSHFVRIGYFLLIASTLLPIALAALPRSTLLRPGAQIWSGSQTNASSSSYLSLLALLALSTAPGSLTSSNGLPGVIISKDILLEFSCTLGFIVLLLIFIFTKRLLAFHSTLNILSVIKKIGSVTVLASEKHSVAFSAWLPKKAMIVVPSHLIENYSDYNLTIQHEIQHHRHGDTQWLYYVELMKAVFFWNPGIYKISKLLSQFQEFACDEILIHHRKLSTLAYDSCLIRAAESTIALQSALVGATGMAAKNDPSFLKRRIEMILNHESKQTTRVASIFIVIGLTILMTSITYASKSTLQNKQLSLNEAKKYEVTLNQTSKIPITVNELVLEKLNHFIGSPEGRKWTKDAMDRMPQYQEMIIKKMNAYDVPEELMALPFFESGFKNLPPTPPQKGAGIWEFIDETAKQYQLNVADQNDERLNPEKETQAAMEYLKDLNQKFKDWRLVIKAYNESLEPLRKNRIRVPIEFRQL